MAKYDLLRDHLRRRSGAVELSFAEVSDLVPGGLPNSAYRYAAWWNNGDETHSHCRSWGDAGFDAHADIPRQRVRFVPRL
ncbi:DUF7662 domain-containing protein [Micromonospora sp. CPCC 205547]|uniref:DUF7662 domain-containing protein n=1 Tax=Micromonospora sp. CPCC 205547 TaxID=3122400 RepID=UPI003B967A0B